MSSSETLPGDLTELQHRSRERSLTLHHASRAHHDACAVVVAGSEMILVCDASGDITGSNTASQGLGLFYRDTRFVSVYELTLNRLSFSSPASRLTAERAQFDFDLDSGARHELAVEIAPRLGEARTQ